MSRQTPHAVYTEALSLDEALNIIRTRNRHVTRPGDRGRREYQAALAAQASPLRWPGNGAGEVLEPPCGCRAVSDMVED